MQTVGASVVEERLVSRPSGTGSGQDGSAEAVSGDAYFGLYRLSSGFGL